MTYQEASEFSRSWGLVFLVLIFSAGVLYAMWPSNKRRFDEASQIPLMGETEE